LRGVALALAMLLGLGSMPCHAQSGPAPVMEQSLGTAVATATTAVERKKQKAELLNALTGHRDWLHWWNQRYQFVWYGATLAVIVLTGLTSIFAALGLAESRRGKATIIVLPAVATLISTALVQFQIRENWQLRELGRVEFDKFIVEASLLDVNDAAFGEKLLRIHTDALGVQREQAQRFFAGFTQRPDSESPPVR
jgi:hypothetical protein